MVITFESDEFTLMNAYIPLLQFNFAKLVMDSKKQAENNLILIRHGQSNFNRGYLDFLEQNQVKQDITWENCLTLPGFNQAVSYSQLYLDSSLTEQGRKQCQKAREMIEDQQIDLVLVSPYQRALETCHEIFLGKNVRVEVHPILAEVFRFSCDIGHGLQEKIKTFSWYDFSHMKDASELWFIEHLAPHHHEAWNNHIASHSKPLSFSQKQKQLLYLLKEKVIYQSAQELRERIWKLKQILADYNKRYNKIAIVSHYHIVQCILGQQFDQQGYVVKPRPILNAHPIYTSLQHLLQFK